VNAEEDPLRSALRELGAELRREFSQEMRQYGPFRPLRLIGSGATSEVYAAAREGDAGTALRYAVKVVRPGADVREVLERFAREQAIVARIAHPGVVPVVASGMTDDARPWFAMPLVEGEPVTVAADRAALSLAARVQLLVQVLEVVAAAHDAGVVHRDLKPGNILVEEHGGVLAPRLIDFGIARALGGASSSLTPNDHVHRLGTPDYMSPEQWKDGVAACDARSDVFALGIVLGEVLAGVLPREPRQATRRSRKPTPVVPPSAALGSLLRTSPEKAHEAARRRGLDDAERLAAALRGRIDTVVAHATDADPAARPADARELAAEVRRSL
jgi:serine/threonine protein kinase